MIISATTIGAREFQGFSSFVHGDIYGQPRVIDDIDGDGVRDIIFGATDGKVHIFSAGRQEEIFRPPYWPKQTGGPILASIELADLTGDGKTEIVVASQDGKIYCLDSIGRELWTKDTRGRILISSPEIADIEGRGELNLIMGTGAGTVSRIDSKGRLVWEIPQVNSVSAAVVARDLNNNGHKEIITKDNSGNVIVLSSGGIPVSGWPIETAPNLVWPFNVDANDVTGDGALEIFTTTPDKKFKLWDREGNLMSSFKLTDGAHTAPVIADINMNGKDEIVIAQADGVVLVTDINGNPLPGWPYETNHAIYNSPTIIDIDGSGVPNIVFTAWDPLGEDEEAGYIMALNSRGQPIEGYPKYIGKTMAPLTFADLNNNGYMEMIAAGGINFTGPQLHVFPTRARRRIRMAVLGQEIDYD